MERDNTIERIKSCMFLESVCSSVYHLLALNFPEESDLWSKLAMTEEYHAETIAKALEIKEPEKFDSFTVPGELEHVKKTIDYAEEIRKKLIRNKVSLKDAVVMVKRLQELKNESYSRDFLEKEKEKRLKRVFQRLFDIDKGGEAVIRTLMDRYGLSEAETMNK